MKIKNFPLLNSRLAEEIYSKLDGVKVKYVCTTELAINSVAVWDIFYRETPHPKFGNNYFGLGNNYIINADSVEELTFGMIDIGKDEWTYSRYGHDFLSWGSAFIDGGRQYTRVGSNGTIPKVKYFKVKDGEFVEAGNE